MASYGDIKHLDREQQTVIKSIIRRGERRYAHLPRAARNRRIETALAVGYTESRFRNLKGGDRDSQGWRQERKMYYKNPRNLGASIERFYDEYDKDGRKGSLGQRAQAIQQSGTPHVWDNLAPLAKQLHRQFAGQAAESTGLKAVTAKDKVVPGKLQTDYGAALLDALISNHGRPGLLARTQAKVDSGAYTSMTEERRIPGVTKVVRTGTGGEPTGHGKLVGNPADRPGAKTKPEILNFARRTAGIYGHPIRLGTGTAHNRLTVNGNVSAHWDGNALDLPARGSALVRMGQAALVAAGMPRAKARKMRGGLYNVGGYQIIFNTHEGGDHTNHLHIGRRR